MTRFVSRRAQTTGAAIMALTLLAGCQTAYFNAMESLGYHKRDLLVDRVEDARDSQQEAKEQFKSALERFGSVVNFDGGSLEAKYKKLDGELERAKSKADEVSKRIDSVQDVAEALFKEWKAELREYSSAKLRNSSEAKLQRTRVRYDELITAMRKAESKIKPVLVALNDQVLFLKHNLNARALASLQDEYVTVEADTDALVHEMEASIAEADEFIREMVAES